MGKGHILLLLAMNQNRRRARLQILYTWNFLDKNVDQQQVQDLLKQSPS